MSYYVTLKGVTMNKHLQQAVRDLYSYVGPGLVWTDTGKPLTRDERQTLASYMVLERHSELCSMGVYFDDAKEEAEADIREVIDNLERGI